MKIIIKKLIGRIFSKIDDYYHGYIDLYKATKFKRLGKHTVISNGCSFTYSTISIGEHTYIGRGCLFHSVHGEIEIGNHVMFGPGVHIHGGNHISNQIGVYMDTITKEYGSDGKVIIEDDVWIGAKATILKGVRICEGAVVAAGSIVTKAVPPYCIVAGVPAKVVKLRFSEDEIKEHKRLLSK